MFNICHCSAEATESRVVQGEGLHEGATETNFSGPCQEILLTHGLGQGEGSDGASVHTASTSASGNG